MAYGITHYPTSLIFATIMLSGAGVAGAILTVVAAIIAVGSGLAAVILIMTWAEVNAVHLLVNSQHDALVQKLIEVGDRSAQLLEALKRTGAVIPIDEMGADR